MEAIVQVYEVLPGFGATEKTLEASVLQTFTPGHTGVVRVMVPEEAVHPLASVTRTEYVPGARPDLF